MTPTVARLRVVVPHELAAGFRLAGAEVVEADEPDAAWSIVMAALRDGEPGLVGVYEPYYGAFDAPTVEACERSEQPIVIAVPAGLGTGDGAGHRARVAALLERAVGYHITFTGEAR